jgi:hypothetical protein
MVTKHQAIQQLLAAAKRLQEAHNAEQAARAEIGEILDAFAQAGEPLQSQAWAERSAGDIIRESIRDAKFDPQSKELQG